MKSRRVLYCAAMAGSVQISASRAGERASIARALGWLACLAAMYGLFVGSGDRLRDPDSTLYAQIAHQLAAQPLDQWIAPEFPPGRFKSGPFMEHLAVFFWPAAALDRIGFSHGEVLANFAYALLLLYLLFQLGECCADRETAWVLVGSYLVSPLGIQYLVRANHENAWALGVVGGVLCVFELGRWKWAGPVLIACAIWTFLIKGALGLAFFPVVLSAAWVIGSRRALAWSAIAAMAVLVAAGVYELVFRKVTGRSFFAEYLAIQGGYVRAFERHGVVGKLLNPLYYAANLLWFALPGSLGALGAIWRARQERRAPLAFRLGASCAAANVALLSLMTRRAVRYVFPAYGFLQLAGASELARTSRIRAWIGSRSERLPYLAMLALIVILALRVAADRYAYHSVDLLGGLP